MMTGVSPAHLTWIGMGATTSTLPYWMRARINHESPLSFETPTMVYSLKFNLQTKTSYTGTAKVWLGVTDGLLRQMEIDIAVDLMGHTEGARPGILAYRPAQ